MTKVIQLLVYYLYMGGMICSVLWGAHKLSEEHIGATGHPHYYLNTKVRTLGKLKYGRFFFAGMLIFDRKLKNR